MLIGTAGTSRSGQMFHDNWAMRVHAGKNNKASQDGHVTEDMSKHKVKANKYNLS